MARETITTSDDSMAMGRENVISYPILELIKAKSNKNLDLISSRNSLSQR